MPTIGKQVSNDQPIKIDLSRLIETRCLIQANSGSGKSWLIRRLLEQTHGKVQQIVLDIEGEFASLRERFDYVLAGVEGDIPANIKVAPVLARRLMELGTSAIIDLYELKHHERVLFVKRFLDALLNLPKKLWHPCLVVIDEAHIFCPQTGKSESMSSVIDLCTRGRKRGFCGVLATQRLSKLHKDAAAETLNKFVGRTGLDVDMKRAGDELGFSSKADVLRLRDLDPGQFFVFGPAITKSVTQICVGDVKTTHPKVGARNINVPPPATAKVKKALQGLIDLSKEADKELRTTEDLKQKIRELKFELRKKPKPQIDKEAVNRLVDREAKKAFREGRNSAVREVNQLQIINRKLENILAKVRQVVSVSIETSKSEKKTIPLSEYKPKIVPLFDEKIEAVKKDHFESDFMPSNPQKVILTTLAQFKAVGLMDVPKKMVAGFSMVRPTSGAYSNNLSRLRTAGYIDYRKPGYVNLTDSGQEYVGEIDNVPATSGDLQEKWKGILSGPQSRILDYLVSIYPDDIAKEELAEQLDVSPTSGAYSNNLSAMRTLGIIDYPKKGFVKGTKMLFIEEIKQGE